MRTNGAAAFVISGVVCADLGVAADVFVPVKRAFVPLQIVFATLATWL